MENSGNEELQLAYCGERACGLVPQDAGLTCACGGRPGSEAQGGTRARAKVGHGGRTYARRGQLQPVRDVQKAPELGEGIGAGSRMSKPERSGA
jgi:hypothetical protein